MNHHTGLRRFSGNLRAQNSPTLQAREAEETGQADRPEDRLPNTVHRLIGDHTLMPQTPRFPGCPGHPPGWALVVWPFALARRILQEATRPHPILPEYRQPYQPAAHLV